MNTLVSAVSIASASAIPASAATAIDDDRAAFVARGEQMVEVLRTRHVCDGWRFDVARADRFLKCLRSFDLNNGDSAEFAEIRAWVSDHGQSFDWLFDSDASGMICRCAKVSAQGILCQSGASDDEINALAQRVIELYNAHGAAITASTPFEEKYYEWQRENPCPTDADGFAKWKRRKRDARRRTGFRAAEQARSNAGLASVRVIRTLIAMQPRTLTGLTIKAKTMQVVDPDDLFGWHLADDVLGVAADHGAAIGDPVLNLAAQAIKEQMDDHASNETIEALAAAEPRTLQGLIEKARAVVVLDPANQIDRHVVNDLLWLFNAYPAQAFG